VRRSDPRPTPEVLALFGVEPHPCLEVRRLRVLHRRGSFILPRASFLARAAAAGLAARRRGATVFTRDLQLADLLLRLPAGGRGRVVYEAHAVESILYRERGVLYGTPDPPQAAKADRLRRRENRVWRRARAFVATTAGIRDTFREQFGTRSGVAVVANGCDVPVDRTFPGLAAQPRVLYAGQLYPWKGVDVLVDAVARVPSARLVVLGGIPGEADFGRVKARAEALGIADRVELRGLVPQAEVARELALARVVAVPVRRSEMTLRHTSPLKAFEAMAAGRPILASDLPSSREFLRHAENAWLVAPDDPAALAEGLARLLEDDALSERIARAAFEDAVAFSWDARARRLMDVFAEIA